MQALILGGGYSTRLYPITKYFPKALLPIGDKTIVEYLINDILSSAVFSKVSLISNHRYYSLFETWLRTKFGSTISLYDDRTNDPQQRLGAIGDILYMIDKNNINEDLAVFSSDTISTLKINNFINFFRHYKGVINSVFDTHDTSVIAGRLGCVGLQNNAVIWFEEKPVKPKSTITSIPYYIFPKESFTLIKEYCNSGCSMDAPGSIISWLIGRIPVFAFDIGDGIYQDVGTIECYNSIAQSCDRTAIKKLC